MLVSVRGVPGSGKTFLCSLLNDSRIECFDTDDYVAKAFQTLIKTHLFQRALAKPGREVDSLPPKAQRRLFGLAKSMLQKDLDRSKAKIKVVVGVTLLLNTHRSFFIRLVNLKEVFHRLIKREIQKAKDVPLDILSKSPQPGLLAHFVYGLGAVNLDMSLANYRKMYKGALDFEKKRGAWVGTQQEIANQIYLSFKTIGK